MSKEVYLEALESIGSTYYNSKGRIDQEYYENLYVEKKETLQQLIDKVPYYEELEGRDKAVRIQQKTDKVGQAYYICPICGNTEKMWLTNYAHFCLKCCQRLDLGSGNAI